MKEIDLTRVLEDVDKGNLVEAVQELVTFAQQIQPAMESINSTLADNVQKVPKATKKLSKVTEATELATNEIMDMVDKIMADTMDASTCLNEIKNIKINELLKNIKESWESKKDISEHIEDINSLITFEETVKIDDSIAKLDEINMFATSIMMSLQVQDITSQQIAAVNHLLTSIQMKLMNITKKIGSSEINSALHIEDEEGTNVSTLHRDIAFDPDAISALNTDAQRQDVVDSLMDKHTSGTLTDEDMVEAKKSDDDDEEMDPADLDALFAAQSGADDSSSEEVDPDDIDALFGQAGSSDDEVSQDDIDALFGG